MMSSSEQDGPPWPIKEYQEQEYVQSCRYCNHKFKTWKEYMDHLRELGDSSYGKK